jgi:hypothetical protein
VTERVRLGDWTCPSGNNVEAFYRPLDAEQAVVEMEWDAPPPLAPIDEAYYRAVIRPALVRRVHEYTEATSAAVVISL